MRRSHLSCESSRAKPMPLLGPLGCDSPAWLPGPLPFAPPPVRAIQCDTGRSVNRAQSNILCTNVQWSTVQLESWKKSRQRTNKQSVQWVQMKRRGEEKRKEREEKRREEEKRSAHPEAAARAGGGARGTRARRRTGRRAGAGPPRSSSAGRCWK